MLLELDVKKRILVNSISSIQSISVNSEDFQAIQKDSKNFNPFNFIHRWNFVGNREEIKVTDELSRH